MKRVRDLPKSSTSQIWYTPEEAAQHWRISERWIKEHLRQGIPGAYKFGRSWRINRLEFEDHLRKQTNGARSKAKGKNGNLYL